MVISSASVSQPMHFNCSMAIRAICFSFTLPLIIRLFAKRGWPISYWGSIIPISLKHFPVKVVTSISLVCRPYFFCFKVPTFPTVAPITKFAVPANLSAIYFIHIHKNIPSLYNYRNQHIRLTPAGSRSRKKIYSSAFAILHAWMIGLSGSPSTYS